MAEPTIYKATYSSVPVYETPCQGVAVMRRKSDSWLNATQILKVAGFDKPQRTRVLEREVQKGTHEKVQGGYGKYQGTWVPMERGIALARQYGVDRLLQPIFDYVPTADSPPLAPKHITAPPLRPKKKVGGVPGADDDVSSMSLASQKSSRIAVNKANAAAKRLAENKRVREREEEEERREREREDEMMGLDEDEMGDGSESETPSPLGSDMDDDEDDLDDDDGDEYMESGGGGRSKKRKLSHHHQQPSHHQLQQHSHHSQHQSQSQLLSSSSDQQLDNNNSSINTVPASSQMGNLGPLRYARMILDYFVSESTQVPHFLVTPPSDFDPNVVIDDDGHTALHWACAMGRIRIVKLLLSAGADIFRANSMGQTALMRSVMFTNNYDLRKFPELFELLHRSTINIDRGDRTVFHYIVDIALQKGKTAAARYYVENVLLRLVDYPKEVADILNFQDEEGETALTLAARARSKRLVKILLDNGADPKIRNRDGKNAEDYILEDERFREGENNLTLAAGGFGATGGGTGNVVGGGGVQPMMALVAQQLHSSEVGQRISTTTIPAIADLLESLATSFDTELSAADAEILNAQTTLTNIELEVEETRRHCQELERSAGGINGMEFREQELIGELENRMGKRFRLGWEKWVRDEDQRETTYDQSDLPAGTEPDLDELRSLKMIPPTEAERRSKKLRAEIEELKGQRCDLFSDFAKGVCESGTGRKMGVYRSLIAIGCGVGMDRVDQVIENLLEGDGGLLELERGNF